MTRILLDPGTGEGGGGRVPLRDEELTGKVIGGFYAVYNTLGYGFLEAVYTRAMVLELRRRGLRVEREVWIAVF